MKKICVFCGSANGLDPVYGQAAQRLGREMAEHGLELVYGGGSVGLMGKLADAVMSHHGRVTGIIPRFLADRELGHHQISELIFTETMHQRKQKMAEMADGFIALPGGFGTLEELCEILTWVQLSLVKKPVALMNTRRYFDHLLGLFDHMVSEGFLQNKYRQLVFVEEEPKSIINHLVTTRKASEHGLGLT